MKCYSYVVVRDYGFAPNPFGPYCTLATCKQDIRKSAVVGDWIVGTGSAQHGASEKLVFAMRVTEKLTFNEYWECPRFQYKKPVLNGSLKQMYGDNIYVQRDGKWMQANSHHSNENGSPNMHNVRRDTSHPFVLVSNHFYYLGGKAISIPLQFCGAGGHDICHRRQGHRYNFPREFAAAFLDWLESTNVPGCQGDPLLFSGFERYDGIS